MKFPNIEPLEARYAPATISIANVSVAEGNSGTTPATFTISLSEAAAEQITVHLTTTDGTAISTGSFADYVAQPDTTVTFEIGETSKDFAVQVIGDQFLEADQTFSATLSSPSGSHTIGTGSATATITNDDAAPVVTISNAADVTEGAGATSIFTITLSHPIETDVTVNYATGAGADTAKPAPGLFTDYIAKSGTVTFSAVSGVLQQDISIALTDDIYKEATEQFTVTLSGPTGGATLAATPSAIGKILNDSDANVGLHLDDARKVEGSSDSTLVLKPTLSGPFGSAFSVTLATQNGTAVAGSDFSGGTPTPVTFAATDTSKDFSVTIEGDTVFEATESFFVNITGAPDGVTVINDHPIVPSAQGTARVYIFNDDVQNLGPRKVQWIDVDGDLVTMTVTKGALPLDNATLFTFENVGTVGGRQLEKLNLAAFITSFAGTGINITATKQAGFPDETDGRVDVGFIQAAFFIPQELQVIGLDLTTVTIDGDLARISAGDQFSTPAIGKLDVYSLGANATTLSTLSSDLQTTQSDVLGPITTMNVKTDVAGFLHVIGAEFGRIGTLKVEGALKGGAGENSGRVTASGKIGTAIIGSIVGGSGANSGVLSGTPETGGAIGTVTVHGDVVGSSGASSGAIFSAKNMTSVTIDGNLKGGTGTGSGSIGANGKINKVVVGEDVVGGNSTATEFLSQSGFISATQLTSVTVGGDIRAGKNGGGGIASAGGIRADVIGSLVVKGDLIGDHTVGAPNPVVIGAAGLTNNLAIKSVSIGGKVDLAEILAGYDTATTATNFRGTPVNGDASIGTVAIDGTARELNVVAGGKLGSGTEFGTVNNVVIPAAFGVSNNNPLIFSKIASVVIRGGLAAEKNPTIYGIVAQSIGTIKIGATTIPLQSGPYNDRPPKELGPDATYNFRAVELAFA